MYRFARHHLVLTAVALTWFGPSAAAQMVTGQRMKDFDQTFGTVSGQREYPYTVSYAGSSAPANILWPTEQAEFTFTIHNHTGQHLKCAGQVHLIAYGTRGIPGDIWTPEVFKIADVKSIDIAVDVPAGGEQRLSVSPNVPEQLGGYALVSDLGAALGAELGRQFITSFVRTFKANPERLQYPKMSLDNIGVDALRRLGIQALREGLSYVPSFQDDYPEFRRRLAEDMAKFKDNNITVLLLVGTGSQPQVLGRPRPHLSDDGVMLGGKSDYAWAPELDDDFEKVVREISEEFGWPKGPVTAFGLWNEPWEGLSISGWGADMLRYREMYMAMARGVHAARENAGVEVLVTGADSSSNTFDKFFSDGSAEFLPYLDAVTIHYQGMSAPSTVKEWINRKEGRVLVWDTESWVANTDDRVATVIAANRSVGYDRSMGVYGGNIRSGGHTWPVAAAVGAAQHFLGERPFRELLFQNGLPWVMVFDGENGNAEDGTIVVSGDIGEAFGHEQMLYRTVDSTTVVQQKMNTRQQLNDLPADAPEAEREKLLHQLTATMGRQNGKMIIANPDGQFTLYDFYGNPVATDDETIVVPLDHRGFFLRSNGKPGSFAALLQAIRSARVEGIEPLEIIAFDMTAPIPDQPTLRLKLTNMLNRPVAGKLITTLGELSLEVPAAVRLKAHETKVVELPIRDGKPNPQNAYPLQVTVDCGADGVASHDEMMRVNSIDKRTIEVDGKLDDWEGVLPQLVSAKSTGPTRTEAAWWPMSNFAKGGELGLATGYLAYDDKNFYFAAKVADAAPDKGTVRFASRDEDAYFYPEVSYEYDKAQTYLHQLGTHTDMDDKDERLLQLPSGGQRSRTFWENTNKNELIGFDLSLPAVRATQVAIYPGFGELHPNGQSIQLLDQATGKVLAEHHWSHMWDGSFMIFEASGNVRVRMRTHGDWYTIKCYGVFLDDVSENVGREGTTARFVNTDYQIKGNWIGKYGMAGHFIVGQEPKLPEGVTIKPVEQIAKKEYRWPEGIRRFSYRKWPTLPAPFVPAYDSVQIAFNAIPIEDEPWLPSTPGTPPRYVTFYRTTDYEYALNVVAPEYGGGTEVWRLQVPGMPRKHFYPRQPKSPFDGPAVGAKLTVNHVENTRITEVAIPWEEIPHVHELMKQRKPLKFSFRANNSAGPALPDLAVGRSVSKQGGAPFHVDWSGGWANELEFGWGN